MPISLCTLLDSNVTEPFQPFAFHQASRHEINTAEATYQPHIYSIILHPSAPFLHLPSILTSCPLKPAPFAPLPQSLFPHVLTRSHSLSLPPLFLSIHTTESLLIICDLLKYIHCQSLSFPLSLTHFAFPLSVSLALSLCPAFYSENLLALLIPSLWALSVSFVFLFCRIIWVPPSTSSLYRREVTNTVRHG